MLRLCMALWVLHNSRNNYCRRMLVMTLLTSERRRPLVLAAKLRSVARSPDYHLALWRFGMASRFSGAQGKWTNTHECLSEKTRSHGSKQVASASSMRTLGAPHGSCGSPAMVHADSLCHVGSYGQPAIHPGGFLAHHMGPGG
jgi:hypothetical protein